MERWLGSYSDVAYALMRLVVGLLLACHGAQKLFGVLGGQGIPLRSLLGMAGVIELTGGTLVALGLWAGYAGFVASGQMAVAYFMAHAPGGVWPIVNKGELAVLYCFVLLYIASRGSGRLSLEGRIRRGGC
jgi:putative oxidoreductase